MKGGEGRSRGGEGRGRGGEEQGRGGEAQVPPGHPSQMKQSVEGRTTFPSSAKCQPGMKIPQTTEEPTPSIHKEAQKEG